jgi:hypothetical protein
MFDRIHMYKNTNNEKNQINSYVSAYVHFLLHTKVETSEKL